ncbi:hypothetical protein KY285_033506 [Solanum tuberosum]|nr:hypothetical protein KY285_033506 [Solanum tuberosum]
MAQVRATVSWAAPKVPAWGFDLLIGLFIVSFISIVMVICFCYFECCRPRMSRAPDREIQDAHIVVATPPVVVETQEAPIEERHPVDPDDIIRAFTLILSSEDIGGDCSICLEYFIRGDTIRVPPCGHMYHHECIRTWMLTGATECPLCRQDYYSI